MNRRWPAIAAALFAVVWLLAAYKPWFPQDWALENVLSLLTAWWLLRRYRRAPFSDTWRNRNTDRTFSRAGMAQACTTGTSGATHQKLTVTRAGRDSARLLQAR